MWTMIVCPHHSVLDRNWCRAVRLASLPTRAPTFFIAAAPIHFDAPPPPYFPARPPRQPADHPP